MVAQLLSGAERPEEVLRGRRYGPLDPETSDDDPDHPPGYWWVGTHADRDDIETLAGLDGMKLPHSSRVAAPSTWFEACLNEAGAEPDQLSFMPFSDAASAMQSRNVDASLFLAIDGAIVPAPTRQAFQSVDIKGVGIPEDMLTSVRRATGRRCSGRPSETRIST